MTGRELVKAAKRVATPDPETDGMEVTVKWADGFTRPVTVYPGRAFYDYDEDGERVYAGYEHTRISDPAWNTYWQPRDIIDVLPLSEHAEWAAAA